jgi:hypothetical protein
VETFPDGTVGTGSGWPDPTEPGVPAASLQDGYHWLKRSDGELTVAQWSSDSWSWIMGQIACRFSPKEMAHFDYIASCVPPGFKWPLTN